MIWPSLARCVLCVALGPGMPWFHPGSRCLATRSLGILQWGSGLTGDMKPWTKTALLSAESFLVQLEACLALRSGQHWGRSHPPLQARGQPRFPHTEYRARSSPNSVELAPTPFLSTSEALRECRSFLDIQSGFCRHHILQATASDLATAACFQTLFTPVAPSSPLI